MEEYKVCPYCGETIRNSAQKCRYCGEWIQNQELEAQNTSPSTIHGEKSYAPVNVTGPDPNNHPVSVTPSGVPMPPPVPAQKANTSQPVNGQNLQVMPGQPNHGLQQNIVVQPQIVVENKQEQHVHVEVTDKGGGSESSGCLWTQITILGGIIWGATGSFWYGIATFIIMAICLFIPFLGHAICIILGLLFGVGLGVLAASFGAPTWVAWLIGIFGAVGLIYGNLSQRNEEAAED